MSVETVSLPVFETARGELVADAIADLPDLRYGFVLQECAAVGEVDDIHERHVEGALALLFATDQGSGWRTVPEFNREIQDGVHGRHFDGLAGRYYQAHTTHASDGGSSHMKLERYDLAPAEHQGMQWRWRSGLGLSGASLLDMALFTGPFKDFGPALSSDRVPESRAFVEAGHDHTIVFPNGYDATERSKPAQLFVHDFLAIPHPDTDEYTRLLSLTRIEPAR